ncbi:MAG: sodium-translocating pyrophosphatase, partial [Coriobacteriia bacterium]|nr:sodium-translocating pyrophosphatase [Coriobacteriia bacterium]
SLWALFLMYRAENLMGLQYGAEVMTGFLMGVSVVALFARVGGGIYTKAADVGADLVGKVEAGIPEDDPRNPAVIADNVGDNVGDIAGMGADLFESYVGALLAPMILAITIWGVSGFQGDDWSMDLLFGLSVPLLIAAAGILSSIVGLFSVRVRKGTNLQTVLNRGTYLAAALQVLLMFGIFYLWAAASGTPERLTFFFTVLVGLIAGMAIGKITEYYCSDHHTPVKSIAKAAETGAGTAIISGLGVGMMSTVFPIIVIAASIIVSYLLGHHGGGDYVSGIYGIGLAAVGMLSTIAITIGVDAYGPVADNAGGIAEMAQMGSDVREVTDALDSVGNTTAAIAKGFAVGSAGLTALSLFVAFKQALTALEFETNMSLEQPWVIAGLFIGGMIPFLFAALTMNAVGRTAHAMIGEVRRQFKEIPGIMDGEGKPDYAACVEISTKAALREMVIPGLLAIGVPILAGLIHLELLAGLLAGALITGFLMAIMMSNAGGAWDNAKKLIESGYGGGKGSEAHKAAVVGDTVGDPFKDTSGPSMNTLIKLMTIVALVFMPLFGRIPWLK